MKVYWTQIDDLCNRLGIKCVEYDYYYEAFDNSLGWLLAYIRSRYREFLGSGWIVRRQKAKAKRAFAPPKSYDEAVALYNALKKDYPHWLAGVHNFAYQTLGLEIFDWMQNVDFYYGELLEHKTHYQQLKQVPDFEIRNRLNELIEKLSKVSVLIDERDKHVAKAREILRRGW